MLVGESDCGKITTGRCILRALRPTVGEILFNRYGSTVNMAPLEGKELREIRRGILTIFEDPYSSLNPRMTIPNIVGEALLENGVARGYEFEDRVRDLMALVGPNSRYLKCVPRALADPA